MIVPSHLHGVPTGGTTWHYVVTFPCDVCGLVTSGQFYATTPTVKLHVTNPPGTATSTVVFSDESGAQVNTLTHYCSQSASNIAYHDMGSISYKLDNLMAWQTSFQAREEAWREREAQLDALVDLLRDRVKWLEGDLESAQKRIQELGG